MPEAGTLLRTLLRQRHWQPYGTFRAEYDKAARRIDSNLVGSWPSRAQFNRWLLGQIKGTPYPDHCRVLEEMFPGWSAEQLFQPPDLAPVAAMSRASASPSTMPTAEQLSAEITAGLSTPDIARATWSPAATFTSGSSALSSSDSSDVSHRISQRLVVLAKMLRLSGQEARQLAALAGNVVDLDLRIDLTIAENGSAVVSYRHELFNMTDRPLTRLARELWFVYTTGPLDIRPLTDGKHRVIIQNVATTPNLVKFACQISPALAPGDSAVIEYVCHGGKFVDEWYWRESIRRHTRYATIVMRRRAGQLIDCSATVEQPDGSERSSTEGLVWDYDRDDLVITLTSDYLNPNQTLTMRWDVRDESS